MELIDENEVASVHRTRVEAMRREKERQQRIRRYIKKYAPVAVGILAALILVVTGIGAFIGRASDKRKVEEAGGSVAKLAAAFRNVNFLEIAESGIPMAGDLSLAEKEEAEPKVYEAHSTSDTLLLGEGDIVSEYAILIDVDSGEILAERNAHVRMNPASMTKILTALVAAEQAEDLDDKLTVTREITDYGYINDCSSAGFVIDERVSVRDLLYGTILPSGADAAVGLAVYVSGSQEAFVELMNERLKELGLSKTAHFTNCVGVFDENHYCTAYDIAMILEAAIDNEICREVMSTRIHTTEKTLQNPEGLELSNWFIRRIEDKDSGGKVLGGKTGYVAQSGNCAASFAALDNGRNLVCVTANASGKWRCIEDHVKLYKQFSR
ncbi:D-alanyl-D-alanine carboxypeptidase [bacterium 1xD8-48]|nr:D-alanyl-D-alanine carboxypeptidase [bacterium 1xD8-48]